MKYFWNCRHAALNIATIWINTTRAYQKNVNDKVDKTNINKEYHVSVWFYKTYQASLKKESFVIFYHFVFFPSLINSIISPTQLIDPCLVFSLSCLDFWYTFLFLRRTRPQARSELSHLHMGFRWLHSRNVS
jgi:hypothetical protein